MSSPFIHTPHSHQRYPLHYSKADINSSEFFRIYNPDILRSTECTQRVLEFRPSVTEFLEILGPPGILLFAFATLAFLLLIFLFINTVARSRKHLHPSHKSTTYIVLSVYPVLGLCSYLGIIFPKANAFMDAAAQLWFSLCMLQFFKLTLLYFGGETAFVEHMEGKVLPWRGPPCCCWPCLWCLCPKKTVNKRQIKFIRNMVMQHPFVQSIFTIIGMALWVEGHYEQGNYHPLKNSFVYIFTVTTLSFLFALWAFIVGFKASIPELTQFHYKMKAITFQLSLVFLRFQSLVFNFILLPSGAIPCLPPISPGVFANAILCSLLLGQLVILAVIARHFYCLETPLSVKEAEKSFIELKLIPSEEKMSDSETQEKYSTSDRATIV